MDTKINDPELIEYQVLSEDRRRAVDIFLKGFLISLGVLAAGLKLLIDSKNFWSTIFIGTLGIIIFIFASFFWKKCKSHDDAIFQRLNSIGNKLGFASVVSTRYIFDAAFWGGIILTSGWVLLLTNKILG